MKDIFTLLFISGFLLLLTGCPYGYQYDNGKFPPDPVNFAAVNSMYDDYNSTSPVIEDERYLYFSSNRNSNGAEFDIVGDHFRVFWDKDKGMLTVDDKPNSWKNYHYTDSLFFKMNTGYNEYGPYSLPYLSYYLDSYSYTDLVIFSNDESGKQNLKFVWFTGTGENPAPNQGTCHGPDEIVFLNTDFNDSYLCFYGPGFTRYNYYAVDPGNISELLFCSDRGGNYDIFQAQVTAGSDILEFLSSQSGVVVTSADILNSTGNDKCPYIDGELLVFASDRPGGHGGFDLYYSRRSGESWSEPVNFGSRINTEYDEYRPIVARYESFDNDLMLFSSDRPGGQGGFDLYYVGIARMI